MSHFTTPDFWELYNALPEGIRELANRNFALLKENSTHPSLHFRQVGRFWSARVGIHYRALAIERDEGFVWFWIGSHAEYDALLR